jgi:myosin heavy subunit
MGEKIDKCVDKNKCISLRDTLAKDLFDKVFNWLVKRLNVTLVPTEKYE